MDPSKHTDDTQDRVNRNTQNKVNRILREILSSGKLDREGYGELFAQVSDLVYPFLSQLRMKPLDEVEGALDHHLADPFAKAGMRKVRLVVAVQSIRYPVYSNSNWEVYLTEKGHWILVMSQKRDGDNVYILRTKEDFLEYYDQFKQPGSLLVHPGNWLIEAPRSIVAQVITKVAEGLTAMEQLGAGLLQIDQWFDVAEDAAD